MPPGLTRPFAPVLYVTGFGRPVKAHLHLANQVAKTGQSRHASVAERSLAAKLARFCIQWPPLGGHGCGDNRNARIRLRRLSVLWRDYAACADSIPRGITAGDIRM